MKIFSTENKKIYDICRSTIFYFPSVRGAKESSTLQNCNTIPRVFISCIFLRKYIVVLYPLPDNLGVHITRYAINAPLIIMNSPNDNSVTGYGHTNYKPITSLPVFESAFLYLFPCSIVISNKKIQTHCPLPCHHLRRAQ